MARTVNYSKKAKKIKEMIDGLVNEMENSCRIPVKREKVKLTDIDFENMDTVMLMQIQARISRLILERSK